MVLSALGGCLASLTVRAVHRTFVTHVSINSITTITRSYVNILVTVLAWYMRKST